MKKFLSIVFFALMLGTAMPAFAQQEILKSSAAYPFAFLMVDSADHISPKTGLTPTVTILKANTGSFASPSGAVTELANGWYKVAGNATDTNTDGPIILHATASGADPTDMIVGVVVDYDPRSIPTVQNIVDAVDALSAVKNGTAQAGSSTTITLDTGASAIDNTYTQAIVYIISGTGVGQFRTIVSYNGTTKVATVNRAWTTNPNSSSVFKVVLP